MSNLFRGAVYSVIGIENFDTSNVTNMSYMFGESDGGQMSISLGEKDLLTFDTSKVTKMQGLFKECSGLETIYVSNLWSTASVTDQSTCNEMFYSCTSLIGGAGTSVANMNKTDSNLYESIKYARIDGGTSAPGYFTAK